MQVTNVQSKKDLKHRLQYVEDYGLLTLARTAWHDALAALHIATAHGFCACAVSDACDTLGAVATSRPPGLATIVRVWADDEAIRYSFHRA